MPSFPIDRIILETSKLLKGLQILGKMFVKPDTFKSGNDLPLFPKLLPLWRNTIPTHFY